MKKPSFSRPNLLAGLCAFALMLSLLGASALQAQENLEDGPEKEGGQAGLLLAAPLSGPLGYLGEEAKNGAELAMKTWGGLKLGLLDENGGAIDYQSLAHIQMVVGYFFESRLVADAPLYLFVKKPILLPFIMNGQAGAIGGNFFKMAPSYEDQGRFMAERVLSLQKRPKKITVLYGPEEAGGLLAAAFKETLYSPPPPPPPAKGQKKQAALKPLDKNALIAEKRINSLDDLKAMAADFKAQPDLLLWALSPEATLEAAPWLKKNFSPKSHFWLPEFLALREVGAALISQGFSFNVIVPVDLAESKDKDIADFKTRYLDIFHKYPTWAAALSYDAFGLAIKAVSSGDAAGYLNSPDLPYRNLIVHLPGPADKVKPPQTFMLVNKGSLVYLP